MKTVTLSAYHPWGSNAYYIECWYRDKMLRSFEGHEYQALLELAKAWSIINGFTHWRNSGTKGKL